jgi:Fascin domain
MANFALKTANGHYVCAEGGGGSWLVANRTQPNDWEFFAFDDAGGERVTIRAHNGQYVCAEPSGAVFANRGSASTWEHWTVVRLDGGAIALRSAHGKFLCAEGGGGGAVVANRDAASTWETFVPVPPVQITAAIGVQEFPGPGDGGNL